MPVRPGEDSERDTTGRDHAEGALEAAVFDLDGVVTLTARVHYASWKDMFDLFLRARAEEAAAEDDQAAFAPFTEADYRAHVDGRPRYDGVRTFLASRGLEVAEGDASDLPSADTVQALGNRKQELFRELVTRDGVEVDDEAVRLVRELRGAGVAVGVATSSKNAGWILERAGLGDLFQARVDGRVSERLRLRGKPEADIFVACLELLGRPGPARAMVVEDAVAGVRAGRAGGFGLVLGVDREGDPLALRESGAHWVVSDLSGLSHERLRAWFTGRAHARPNALATWDELSGELRRRPPAIFLDYDGTLAPIAARPEDAEMPGDVRAAVRRLARAFPTAVVSGRGREDVERLVDIPELNYAGSHGFDIAGPATNGVDGPEIAGELVPAIAEAAEAIERRVGGIEGAIVENKKYSLAVHYRLVDDDRVPDIERAVDEELARRPDLEKRHGKKVFELRPSIAWDKGRAVGWLLEAMDLGDDAVTAIYIGDDVTDEDAFRALEGRGIGIVVTETPRPTAASYSLQDTGEVRELLERLTALAGGA